MRQMNMLGIAATAAIVLTAVGTPGASSANTTELFSGATTNSVGTEILFSLSAGTKYLLSDTSGELATSCLSNTYRASTSFTTSSQVSAHGELLSWGGCTWGMETEKAGTISITNIGGGDGTVRGAFQEYKVEVFGFLDCVYGTGTGTHVGTLDGVTSGSATISVNAVLNLQQGFFCPETTRWVADYTVTSPAALNVGS